MSIPSTGARVPPSGRKRWHLPTPRRREQAAVLAQNLNLASAGTGVPVAMVQSDPMLLRLAVEDLCWRLESEDLGRHRPRRGDREAQDAWLAEQEGLEAERRRLAAMVAESISAL